MADYTKADAVRDFAVANDLRLRGTTLFWGQDYDGKRKDPEWLYSMRSDTAATKAEIEQRYDTAARYKDDVEAWDLNNEMTVHDWYFPTFGSDYVAYMHRRVKDFNPDVNIYFNDYNLLNPVPLTRFIS